MDRARSIAPVIVVICLALAATFATAARAGEPIAAPAWAAKACEAWRNALDDRFRALLDIEALEPGDAIAVRAEISGLVGRCRYGDPAVTLWRLSLLADMLDRHEDAVARGN